MKYLESSRNGSYDLELNAAVFIQPGIHLKHTYKHALLDFYNAQIYVVDFLRQSYESTQKINQWVKMATRGKLQALYAHPLPPRTVSVMANAVYFNGRWENPFVPDFTKSGPFLIGENQTVTADFMFGEKEVLYKNTSEMQLVGIPYKNWDVVLYILLPHERLATSLSVDHLDRIIASAEKENITLSIPKLKLLSTISVRQSVLKYLMNSERLATRTVIVSGHDARQKKGLTRQSSSSSTTSRPNEDSVFEDAEFKFDDVIHQVSMEVNERGSEIAAATASLVDYSGDNFLLKIDRPFWFFVRHEISSTHLFWGRIVDPTSDRN
ncbi:UNVERIFIED_CONTAM: hypothetical protein PYX00_003929 [Menopon gallinae]|uniref:Serpin domain-containing protein n=1 Tax=Menopon gallinae TaxID=328185 RepID=A0AAW2I3G0_9NEOP